MNTLEGKLKIIHVTFDMGVGGTEQVITQLIQAGDHERFSQEIVCIDGEIGAMGLRLSEHGVKVSVSHRRPGIDLALVLVLALALHMEISEKVHLVGYSGSPEQYMALADLYLLTSTPRVRP